MIEELRVSPLSSMQSGSRHSCTQSVSWSGSGGQRPDEQSWTETTKHRPDEQDRDASDDVEAKASNTALLLSPAIGGRPPAVGPSRAIVISNQLLYRLYRPRAADERTQKSRLPSFFVRFLSSFPHPFANRFRRCYVSRGDWEINIHYFTHFPAISPPPSKQRIA